VLSERELRAGLRRYWGLDDVSVAVHNGGMGSATWFLCHDDGRWVAKAVGAEAGSQFAGGLRLVQLLDRAGIPAGAPLPTMTGQLAVELPDCWLAVLAWVPGHPLTGHNPAERELIGTTLARVHLALAGGDTTGAQRFHWVDPEAKYLSLRHWLRPAITDALAALDAADPASMSWGLLHADPAPEAFRLDPATGQCGIIDWSYLLHGPLLYDLASAVTYVGGPAHARDLIEAYLEQGMLARAEVDQGLAAMLRFQWAVQANYFAWRIAENDLTGISGPGENEKGLEDARRSLTLLSVGLGKASRNGCLLSPSSRLVAPRP
jgi:Ser/Thr protein kinase RdoA (MazF antagonist)